MPIKVDLNSMVFKYAQRRQAKSAFIGRQAKDFKNLTQRRMIAGPQTGRRYTRRRGAGFVREHVASTVGQRPAPDTMTLVNAVNDKRLTETSAEVFIGPKINPTNGTVADVYADILQNKLNRPIMTASDAEEAQQKMVREGEQLAERFSKDVA